MHGTISSKNHLVILMVWVNLGNMVDLLKLVDMVYLVNLAILLMKVNMVE